MPKDEEVWKAAHTVIDRIADDRRSASAPVLSIASIASTEEAIEIARDRPSPTARLASMYFSRARASEMPSRPYLPRLDVLFWFQCFEGGVRQHPYWFLRRTASTNPGHHDPATKSIPARMATTRSSTRISHVSRC